MKLTALRLHNVRRFAGRGVAIEGIADGVNVLCAANEYGKSTCFDAMHAVFFQPHSGTPRVVQSLRPYSGGSPLIEVDIATDNGRFRLSKQFYSGRHARITDLGSGRLIAQADEAERFIAALVQGGAGGPSGLLWIRQGDTDLERPARSDEEGEKRARESVLSSVQGEVEVLTGGRRMTEVIAACQEELSRYVTATGRPRTGGPFATAIEERDRLAEVVQRFNDEVRQLHDSLDRRRKIRARLAELENPEEIEARGRALETAEQAFVAAKAHGQALERAEASARFARGRYDSASTALENHRALTTRADELREHHARAQLRRDEARDRQRRVIGEGVAAEAAVESAEAAERDARNLLLRLDRAMRARDAKMRLDELREALGEAQAARAEVEAVETLLRALIIPPDRLQALEKAEAEVAAQRAAESANAPTIRVDYDSGIAAGVAVDGDVLRDREERALAGVTKITVDGIGTLTFSTRQLASGDRLKGAEQHRRKLLEQMGVATLTEAREKDFLAKQKKATLDLAKQRLALRAPSGVDALRDEIARLESADLGELELKGDPIDVRRAHEITERTLTDRRNAARALRPAREKTDDELVQAERALAGIASELAGVETQLGPVTDRGARANALAREVADAQAPLRDAENEVAVLRASAPDLDSTEATLRRMQSAVKAATQEASDLREQLADLTGRIRTRSDDAVEELRQEAVDAHAAAEANLARIEREVALLNRLHDTLAAARTSARDHYFEPVMRELHPLLGLLFEDAVVVFDGESHLPRAVLRNGQEEDVRVLSAGMREQLAVLTRLAFAKLLAKDGRPAPVILDDALVYSDDDRIEKMFDALHRQARDQQIIVFSCRQRAFTRLGGNVLHLKDWTPQI